MHCTHKLTLTHKRNKVTEATSGIGTVQHAVGSRMKKEKVSKSSAILPLGAFNKHPFDSVQVKEGLKNNGYLFPKSGYCGGRTLARIYTARIILQNNG